MSQRATTVMTNTELHLFSEILDNMVDAACFSDGMRASLGWRRKQWAVMGPDGGTRRVVC